eukprot:TRINITY_DN94554_c0_g1_i1.p1 TRINITY_DN94554_c0_g1~~TRINITY_DN94554_c0_g1_i1.p1  ORF type:complete len:603 (+),score=87.63 TRINITY_DN94554_c0_g1_i1:35-1810(+)
MTLAGAAFLLALQLQNGLAGESLTDKMTQEAIAAASVVRIQGTGYQANSSSCVWPACAPTCMPCMDADKMGDCFVPLLQQCAANAECLYGNCFCNAGYCPVGGTCVWQTCSYGAKPPAFQVNSKVRLFASLGPDPPGANATMADWEAFVEGNMYLPIGVLISGVVIAVVVFVVIKCYDWQCDCLPTQPYLLLGLSAFTALFILAGVISRAWVVGETFSYAESTLTQLEGNVHEALERSAALQKMANSFQAAVNSLPDSCTHLIPGANLAMAAAAKEANVKLLSLTQKIDAFSNVSVAADKFVRLGQDNLVHFKLLVVYLPIIPLLLMLVGTVFIGYATRVSMTSKDPDEAERMDDIVAQCGVPGTCIAMILGSLVASLFLFAGSLIGSFCFDLDNNVIHLTETVNITAMTNYKYDIDAIVEGAARYYVAGSQENPMINMVQSISNDAAALYGIYTNATWATEPAAKICTGVANLNATYAMQEFTQCCQMMAGPTGFLRASNMWPYYKNLGQGIMCGTLPSSMWLLISFTVMVSHCLMPCLTILADVDLRKWERHKEDNYHSHYGVKSFGQAAHLIDDVQNPWQDSFRFNGH